MTLSQEAIRMFPYPVFEGRNTSLFWIWSLVVITSATRVCSRAGRIAVQLGVCALRHEGLAGGFAGIFDELAYDHHTACFFLGQIAQSPGSGRVLGREMFRGV